MQIRPATPTDADAVREVAGESWHAAYDEILGPETVTETVEEWYAVDGLERAIADAADRDDAVFLLAETDEEVGFANAGPSANHRDAAHLGRIYVRPDRWGEGIGSALLERIERALADEFDRLELEVFADNEVGVSFYESRGFERVDEITEAFGGEEYAVHVYERPIETEESRE